MSKRAPVAAKVPEITLVFWVIKLLTTAGGEATSDYLALGSHAVGAVIETGLLVIGLAWQFRVRRYTAAAYWFLAYAIATFGTGVSDTLHLTFGLPYAATTILWAVVLAGVFWFWHRSEGTLSIHSITTQRRECFYWATVFATFALGTALGDLTAVTLKLGYLGSVFLFAVVIAIPALAWWQFRMNADPRVLVRLRGHPAAWRLGRRLPQQADRNKRRRLRRSPDRGDHDDRGRARSALPHLTRSDIQQPTVRARSHARHG